MNVFLKGILDKFDVENAVDEIINSIREYFDKAGENSKAVIGISGGKDSTVALKLLVNALGPERVITVQMPFTALDEDVEYADMAIEYANIPKENRIGMEIISACDTMYELLGCADLKLNDRITTNLPARVRMTLLYAVAATCHGRVINTSNYSEKYVGYSTKYGDSAGDFGILQMFTMHEVLKIGEYLEIPKELLYKAPSDGLSGKTDEDNLGFTYETLDTYLMGGDIGKETDKEIEYRHERNRHKFLHIEMAPNLGYNIPFVEEKD